MADYSDFPTVLKLLEECQSADEDNRTQAKDAHLFVSKKDGQWEPYWWSQNEGKPRYTFDQTSPIIDQISGDIDDSDFDVNVMPMSADATEEGADLLAGIIRGIERKSEAKSIYSKAGRNTVTAGYDNWMVTTDYADDNSFNQELCIKSIPNSADRVWYGLGGESESRSDSSCGFLLSAIPVGEYKEEYPDRAAISVSQGEENVSYYNKADDIILGHIFYQDTKLKNLYLTKLGRVLNEDQYAESKDMLKSQFDDVIETRKVKDSVFYMRKFDGDGWIGEPERTVFKSIPLFPVFGNYKVIENKPVWHGIVLKAMDPQRVLNYSLSREIEEGALAPRAKYWMTTKQVGSNAATLATLNTNSDPVQIYDNDPDIPGAPQQNGGAQINPGLRTISDGMQQILGRTSGIFAAGMGDNPNSQSGIAISRLQDKSNNITSKYFSSMEIACGATYQCLVDAIPQIFDSPRDVRIVNSDGTTELIKVNNPLFDPQTGQPVINPQTGLQVIENDLSVGTYSATCTSGPSFDSRKSESISSITELAMIDPSIMQTGADILLGNLNSPGVDKIADRKRLQLFNAGIIPQDQMTDEEKQMLQQMQQQPQQPDAMMVAAQAEQAKADMQGQKNQLQAQKDQMDAQYKQQMAQLDMQKQQIEFQEKQAKLGLQQDNQQFKQMMEAQAASTKSINDAVANLNTQADTLNKLRDAMSPPAIINEQLNDISEAQD